MQYIAQTVCGIEEIACQEIKELIASASEKILPARLLFEANSVEKLNSETRMLKRIYRFLKRFQFDSLEDIKKNVEDIKFDFTGTFKVKCARKGEHDFNSQETAKEVGEVIFRKGFKVDVKNPENNVLIDIIGNECIIGLDVSDKDLCKREYRIKANKQSINPSVANAMLRLASWNSDKVLLDPFCKDGVIVIEAALKALGVKLGQYDKQPGTLTKDKIFAFDSLMPNVKSTEINAKLANVNKYIQFSKCDLDWLDTKFGKASIDCIVSSIIVSEEKPALKLFKELFYQANYVLSENGSIVIATSRKEWLMKYAENYEITEELEITIGELNYAVILIKRIKN